ncbi:TetR/AcrR family transcriptional regulator [Actinopolymorpha alba]|uniref:TetR/AcrR family transcriptional regulator n=1 Tax=Actinopolymorpha alba TaxID=533267 RepID=UPI000370A15C|nr:TetR/AcrR family transcriptional regulator [Actinopolymorpha alba]
MSTSRPDPEDLTARARIRDAAMYHFGEHGFERATIRGIATTAGVSSGLVRHHFGSKQALREACDDYLLKVIRQFNDQAWADPTFSDTRYVYAARATMAKYQRYLARALIEGSATELFDEMVRMSEQWLAVLDKDRPDPSDVDRRARATVGTAMALSVGLLYDHVGRSLGVDLSSPEGDRLLSRILLDLYSHPLMSLEDAARARAALDRAQ